MVSIYERAGIWNCFEIALHKILTNYLLSSSLLGFSLRNVVSTEALFTPKHFPIPQKLLRKFRKVHKQPSKGSLQNTKFRKSPRKHISLLINLPNLSTLNFKSKLSNRKMNNRTFDSTYQKDHLTTLTISVTQLEKK